MTGTGEQGARWTNADLVLAWQLGRDHQPPGAAEYLDDLRHTPTLAPPATGPEERIAMRVADMTRSAAPNEYHGGPVPWEPARPLPPWLETNARRLREQDTAAVEQGLAAPPAYRTWLEVHDRVEGGVWWRVWFDLDPATRNTLAHLAPQLTLPTGDGGGR